MATLDPQDFLERERVDQVHRALKKIKSQDGLYVDRARSGLGYMPASEAIARIRQREIASDNFSTNRSHWWNPTQPMFAKIGAFASESYFPRLYRRLSGRSQTPEHLKESRKQGFSKKQWDALTERVDPSNHWRFLYADSIEEAWGMRAVIQHEELDSDILQHANILHGLASFPLDPISYIFLYGGPFVTAGLAAKTASLASTTGRASYIASRATGASRFASLYAIESPLSLAAKAIAAKAIPRNNVVGLFNNKIAKSIGRATDTGAMMVAYHAMNDMPAPNEVHFKDYVHSFFAGLMLHYVIAAMFSSYRYGKEGVAALRERGESVVSEQQPTPTVDKPTQPAFQLPLPAESRRAARAEQVTGLAEREALAEELPFIPPSLDVLRQVREAQAERGQLIEQRQVAPVEALARPLEPQPRPSIPEVNRTSISHLEAIERDIANPEIEVLATNEQARLTRHLADIAKRGGRAKDVGRTGENFEHLRPLNEGHDNVVATGDSVTIVSGEEARKINRRVIKETSVQKIAAIKAERAGVIDEIKRIQKGKTERTRKILQERSEQLEQIRARAKESSDLEELKGLAELIDSFLEEQPIEATPVTPEESDASIARLASALTGRQVEPPKKTKRKPKKEKQPPKPRAKTYGKDVKALVDELDALSGGERDGSAFLDAAKGMRLQSEEVKEQLRDLIEEARKTGAEAIRKDEGQVQERGDVRQGREVESREDLQRQPEEQGEGVAEVAQGQEILKTVVDRRAQYEKSRELDPSKDELKEAISKLGGLSIDDAIAQGFGDSKAVRGWGVLRLFTKNGKTFDDMSITLAQFGYDTDATANGLLSLLDDSLRGNKKFSLSNEKQFDELVNQYREQQENMFGDLEPTSYHPQANDIGDRILEVAAELDKATGKDTSSQLLLSNEKLSDQQLLELLENELEKYGDTSKFSLEADTISTTQSKMAAAEKEQSDLFAQDTESLGRRQAVFDRQQEIDRKLGKGREEIPLEEGLFKPEDKTNDLFPEAKEQTSGIAKIIEEETGVKVDEC